MSEARKGIGGSGEVFRGCYTRTACGSYCWLGCGWSARGMLVTESKAEASGSRKKAPRCVITAQVAE